jgi:hypothetical protein
LRNRFNYGKIGLKEDFLKMTKNFLSLSRAVEVAKKSWTAALFHTYSTFTCTPQTQVVAEGNEWFIHIKRYLYD